MLNFRLIILLELLFHLMFISGNDKAKNSNCIFLGCSCINNKIRCPSDNSADSFLAMFPKRQIDKSYANNISIEINNNHIEMVPDDRFADLSIHKIDLSSNHISKLSPDSFRDIIKLEILDLSSNRLKYLTPNTFNPVEASLVTLNLRNNHLNEMETTRLTNIFSNLNKLENLYLSSNKLMYIPDLTRMSLLKLDLASNYIETLVDSDTYENLLPTSLNEINLQDNRLKQINENSFESLKNLQYLNLESNEISAIAENSFTHLTNLLVLNLRKNSLKHIPSRIFFTLINLEYLDLSCQNQNLKFINDYAFDRQSNGKPIKRILLGNNNISRIENKAFCSKSSKNPYVNIREIDLSFNLIKSLDSCIIRQLAKGFNDPKISIREKYNAIILFNSNKDHVHSNQHSELIECNCEVTRAGRLVDLEGNCRRTDNSSINLKHYDCGNYSITNTNQIHKYCANQQQFECFQYNDNKYWNEDSSSTSTKLIMTTTLLIKSTLPLILNSSVDNFTNNLTNVTDQFYILNETDSDHQIRKLDIFDDNKNDTLAKSDSLSMRNDFKHFILILIFNVIFSFRRVIID